MCARATQGCTRRRPVLICRSGRDPRFSRGTDSLSICKEDINIAKIYGRDRRAFNARAGETPNDNTVDLRFVILGIKQGLSLQRRKLG